MPHVPAEGGAAGRARGRSWSSSCRGDPLRARRRGGARPGPRRDAAVGPHRLPSAPPPRTSAFRCWRSTWRSSTAAGQPTLEELARAIREFRASGKKVIAYGTELTQERYYLAAQADEIYLDPMGFVLIDGYDRYRMYLQGGARQARRRHQCVPRRRVQERRRDYTRTDMSPEDSEESRAYLNALWTQLPGGGDARAQAARRCARASTSTRLPKTVPAAGGNAAQVALQAGLVTGHQDPARGREAADRPGRRGRHRRLVQVGVRAATTCASRMREKKLHARRQAARRRHRRLGRDPRRRAAAGHHRRRVHGAPDPPGAPGQGHQGGGAARRQPGRQRARLRGDLPRAAGAARRGQAAWWCR